MNIRRPFAMTKWLSLAVILFCRVVMADIVVDDEPAKPGDVPLTTADILVDPKDATVVSVAAGLLADDVERVTGHRPSVKNDPAALGPSAVIIGTIGQSATVDGLIAAGKIDAAGVKGKWESFGWRVVADPQPNVHTALVIIGADRRGTAYGVMELSRRIGVSPWYYWADVPTVKHATLRASGDSLIESSPGVKYRGIFLNDEDWGLRPWATKTLDPATGAMGPKIYDKIFELMLRLRLNYIWPAMHPGGTEFSTFPGNAACADKWAIVTGASHCEPMLRNNVFWDQKKLGEWRYDTNRQNIFDYWKEAVVDRGDFESVWTLGIRGIHDQGMQGPKDIGARVGIMERIIADQRGLIVGSVTKKYGPPAECFVPYKEVLPIYEAGLKVPEDVTVVWPDDNFGYIRRLATADERKRAGGSGVYYHVSYWGSPHSYLWIESTPPGLMWEELHKAYENDSKTIWMLNVGDIKPAEAAIDFYARLAWRPDGWGPDAQWVFLKDFDSRAFGPAGPAVEALQADYYRLASERKPEHMAYGYRDQLSPGPLAKVAGRYQALLDYEATVAAAVPPESADAYFETVGYPARMLAATGLLYCGDPADMKKWKRYVDDQTAQYNQKIAGGKWNRMMATQMEGLQWPAVVGEKVKPLTGNKPPADPTGVTIDAATFQRSAGTDGTWTPVDGLGWSGRAITILPTVRRQEEAARPIETSAEYDFTTATATDEKIFIHALPTLRLTPDGHLRIGGSIDDGPVTTLDVPGGEADNENAKARQNAVQTNRVTIQLPTGQLAAGKHKLRIIAIDRGVVIDQIDLPK